MKKRVKKKRHLSAVKKQVKKWYYHELKNLCDVYNITTNHINIKRAVTSYTTEDCDSSDKLLTAFLSLSLLQPRMSAPHLLATKRESEELK
jgi:hypothetical protein